MTEHNSGAGATRKLADHVATLTYDMLPVEVVALTKRCILDTLGVTMGASRLSPEGRILADYVRDLGGKPESSVFGFDFKAPAGWAVFANGAMGHMLDYDDVAYSGHTSIATIPVAFALAEREGGVSGEAFITAVAAGMDVMCRISQAISIPQWISVEGWFQTQLLGYIAGAATAGRLLGLNADQMENAFGAAFTQTAGSRQMAVDESTDLRSMQAGFSGQGAILAADLARRGIVGSREIIEGVYGFFKTYVRDDNPNWDALVGGLGTRFPILETHGFKIWPHCAHIRPCTAAVLELRRDDVTPDNVERIEIIGGSKATQLLSHPIEAKRRPQVAIDAKYSVPFTTAVAMIKGGVTLQDYTADALNNSEVLAMADRVTYRPDVTANALTPVVKIFTKNGNIHSHQVHGVPGDANNPVGWEEIEVKFRDCVSFTDTSAAETDRAIETVANFEICDDVTDILRLIA
ncbi:MAG: MmgE/PrpD family protein [Rhodospirillaceae bacterium]|jgi:2-methylcitrate dehydratase PrpD|nr:MmgE/PrpD family protein [Rhodospirillaceae bacterium]MBT5667877.1 MmgE/PrpD family protein [Rhodospirillaceae bacterium]MBT5809222.1 MmgE/PrpD family protein [Rhodospirillaceae bacterium]